ncbi:DUF3083 family protein [Pseudoalteromonas mariniglutinosa]|uniref:DUF3083 family protein n=1 Tax=Pseudoalteromonas mariniglutinosa TaxID=206042 RepID=UPI00384F141A
MASTNQHRVYIPSSARANQYLLVEFKPNDAFYARFSDIRCCYKRLSRELFALCDEYELHNVHIIANDKLPVVRYHDEAYNLETKKQILFFYNPKYHEAHNLFVNEEQQSKKIRFLFLATGDELRANAASFHHKVQRVISALSDGLLSDQSPLKIRDHQHLTYDLFAKAKGHKQSYGYKLRSLYPRYQSRNCHLPVDHNEMTYASFSIPVTRAIKTQFQHMLNEQEFGQFYHYIFDAFKRACAKRELLLGAMVANGSNPIVRNSQIDNAQSNAELQKLTFDCNRVEPQLTSYWQADKLVNVLHFVIVAADKDKHDIGYGRFMNHVQSAINEVTDELAFNPTRQDLTVRFFQHINYTY